MLWRFRAGRGRACGACARAPSTSGGLRYNMRGQPWARPPPGPGPAPSNPPPSHGDTHMRTPPRCFSTRTLISMTAQAPRPEDGPCVDGAADLVRPIIMDRDSDSESPFQCQCRLTQYWLMAEAFRRPARFAPLAGACRPGGLARSATRTMPVGLGDSRPRFPQIARDRGISGPGNEETAPWPGNEETAPWPGPCPGESSGRGRSGPSQVRTLLDRNLGP